MREYKFRGKDLKGEWRYGFLFYDYNCTDKYSPFINWKDEKYLGGIGEEEVEEETLGQFTGLYDKNGKEIYEGDIVSFEDVGEEGYEYKEGYDFTNEATIIYQDGIFTLIDFGESENSYYSTNSSEEEILEDILRNGSCEVIGNIYDNKELLEGE